MPEPSKTAQDKRRISLGGLVAFVFKLTAFAGMVAVPLLGTWSASSLAAYWNGPIALTIGAGFLLFPVLPLAWDAWRERARRLREEASKKKPKPRVLTFGDRLVLRTLFLNGIFLGAMVFTWPEALFGALTTRGDWFLDRVEGADFARRIILQTADGLVWIYDAAHDNPYDVDADESEPEDAPSDEPVDAGASPDAFVAPPDAFVALRDADVPSDAATATDAFDAGVSDADAGDAGANPPVQEAPEPPTPSTQNTLPRWPFANVVSPIVLTMPATEETSIERVARYLRAHAASEYDRARAAHDYVATRVVYDTEALASIEASNYRTRFPQHAEAVFRSRRGVCEGYARLFRALAEEMGLEARYLVGDARDASDPLDVEGHAWNAVRIDGTWFLLDVTWDAGGVGEQGFRARYTTDYFLTPSAIFAATHFPDETRWQLRDVPISRGEFQRMPALSPSFYAQGFVLNEPTRAQTEVRSDTFEARVHGSRFLRAAVLVEGDARVQCAVDEASAATENGSEYIVRCPLPRPGTYNVWFFANKQRYGQYESIGALQVIRR